MSRNTAESRARVSEMTITKDEMTEYEFTTEMRDRLYRAHIEFTDVLAHNKGYFEDNEKFKDALVNINTDLVRLIDKVDAVIGIHYRRLTE